MIHASAPTRGHTLQPVVTGASVLGIKCADGVVMSADTLGEATSTVLCYLRSTHTGPQGHTAPWPVIVTYAAWLAWVTILC